MRYNTRKLFEYYQISEMHAKRRTSVIVYALLKWIQFCWSQYFKQKVIFLICYVQERLDWCNIFVFVKSIMHLDGTKKNCPCYEQYWCILQSFKDPAWLESFLYIHMTSVCKVLGTSEFENCSKQHRCLKRYVNFEPLATFSGGIYSGIFQDVFSYSLNLSREGLLPQ